MSSPRASALPPATSRAARPVPSRYSENWDSRSRPYSDSRQEELRPSMSPDNSQSSAQPHPHDTPALPLAGKDDTDTGWGGPPDSDDDDRLSRERPPHWDSV